MDEDVIIMLAVTKTDSGYKGCLRKLKDIPPEEVYDILSGVLENYAESTLLKPSGKA